MSLDNFILLFCERIPYPWQVQLDIHADLKFIDGNYSKVFVFEILFIKHFRHFDSFLYQLVEGQYHHGYFILGDNRSRLKTKLVKVVSGYGSALRQSKIYGGVENIDDIVIKNRLNEQIVYAVCFCH